MYCSVKTEPLEQTSRNASYLHRTIQTHTLGTEPTIPVFEWYKTLGQCSALLTTPCIWLYTNTTEVHTINIENVQMGFSWG